MQIRELYLKNFGKFSNRTFIIREGVNVFYGENEFGKSTLFAFIKGMLFGMERARGRASKHDAFSQYEPWENPNYYAGVLRFESGGRNFRIERSFDKITKSASLICEDDGEEMSIEQGDLDVLLGGMTAESFENTIAIGQLNVETNQNLTEELKNFAANYYESGDSEINVQHALESLKEKKHKIDDTIRQETLKKEHTRSRIEQECEYIRRDLIKLKGEEYDYRVEEAEEKEAEKEMQIPIKSRLNKKGFFLVMIVFLVMIAAEVGLCFISKGQRLNLVVLIGSVVVDVLFVLQVAASLIRLNLKKRESRETEVQRDTPEQRKRWEMGRIRSNIHEKQVRLNNLNERLEEMEASGFEVTQIDKKRQAIELASETIAQMSVDIIKGFGHALNEKASEIIASITDGKYDTLYIDENLHMFLLTKAKRTPIERLSRGTIEQIYFALRMAAIEILYEEEFPVVLDDTFVFYDDARLESVLKWLANQKRQVIIFSCQKRERQILNRLEVPFGINE